MIQWRYMDSRFTLNGMSFERIQDKLKILEDAAKYGGACASSGSTCSNISKGLGDATVMDICHSFTEDERCVPLLKILLIDSAYCVTRKSKNIKRLLKFRKWWI
jgi:predicted DNA-binding helix-hairpin-helix protein